MGWEDGFAEFAESVVEEVDIVFEKRCKRKGIKKKEGDSGQ